MSGDDVGEPTVIDTDGTGVRVSSPNKVVFPETGHTKLDLVNYYLTVGAGALRGVRSRPTVMKRFPHGASGDWFFQKRVPKNRPDWLRATTVTFPSGRSADELCPVDVAHLVWAVNLGCIDFNPWPTRSWEPNLPDEFRVDLDPQPGVAWESTVEVALQVKQLLDECAMTSWPKTSGSRGFHIYVRIPPRHPFAVVRACALAMAREIERRVPDLATSAWFKADRGDKVFIDYNQNARDRTVASAYSVRPTPNAQVSAPLEWSEVPTCSLSDFTLDTMAERWAKHGDLHAGIDDAVCSLDPLLELARKDEDLGLKDAPWPPNYPKSGR